MDSDCYEATDKEVLEKKLGLHCFPYNCRCIHFGGLQKNSTVQTSKSCPSTNPNMSLRRLRADHYKQLASSLIPVAAILFGAYQQFLHDHDQATFRNKSKMFGGRDIPEGKQAWY